MNKINEIATALGLSVSTVYKAFNNAGDISPETRSTVLKKAEQLGYAPKAKAKNHRILVFAKEMEADYITHYLYEVMLAFKRFATESGYEILIIPVNRIDAKHFTAVMKELSAEGCMILVLNEEQDFLQLREFTCPTVLVDNYVKQKNIACVTSDKLNGVEMQIRHLAELGHRKIGFINSKQGAGRKERLAGYINALTSLGINYEPQLVKYGDFSEESGGNLAVELMDQGVTSIACANDLMAIGAIRELKKRHIRIPEDVSIVGFDDIRLANYILPELTTVHISTKNMGMQAFICLRNLLESKVSTRVIEDPKLIVRQSTAPVRKESAY